MLFQAKTRFIHNHLPASPQKHAPGGTQKKTRLEQKSTFSITKPCQHIAATQINTSSYN